MSDSHCLHPFKHREQIGAKDGRSINPFAVSQTQSVPLSRNCEWHETHRLASEHEEHLSGQGNSSHLLGIKFDLNIDGPSQLQKFGLGI